MTGLKMKYFVLKPSGDDRYAVASRKAMRAYALHIQNENEELANDLREWADNEMVKVKDV
ncbi:unnamed protein product [marine sediment metagenome]|uniref:Uncharacterized protein n=1 Tax=marine sediment metagenome TaxID=412755 RepID=X1RZV5_9ZZZZ